MTSATPDIAIVEQHIVELTNEFREQNKLGEVRPNQRLTNAARAYALYLARTNRFSHEADGRLPAERAKNAGYRYCQLAENLALAQDSRGFDARALATQAVEGWMNSPGHKRNLLATHVTEIGVAVAKAPDDHPKYISVQLFGRPDSFRYEFRISNDSDSTVMYGFSGKSFELKPSFSIAHTACQPGELTFRKSTDSPNKKNIRARYTASDNQIYILTTDKQGRIKVSVEKKQTLSNN